MSVPRPMKCLNCGFWAQMDDNSGECGQVHAPERLTKFFVRHLMGPDLPAKSTALGCWYPGPPPDTRYQVEAAMITDKNFYCASFEERVDDV